MLIGPSSRSQLCPATGGAEKALDWFGCDASPCMLWGKLEWLEAHSWFPWVSIYSTAGFLITGAESSFVSEPQYLVGLDT